MIQGTFQAGLKAMLVRRMALPVLSAIWRSCRLRIEGWPHFFEATRGPCILCLWHNQLLLMPHFLRRIAPHQPYCALISHSRDGNLLRLAGQSLDNVTFLSVPHDRKAHVLRSAVEAIKSGKILLVTPDGPKGPAHQIKPGLLATAALSGACILPLHWSAKRTWHLPTWDRMALPALFTEVTLHFGEPLGDIVKCRGQGLQKELMRVRAAMGP